jgi:hypothetical protein
VDGKQDEEALIDALLEEALEGMADGVPAAALEEIRALLAAQLAVTEAGQRLLRSIQPDPSVNSSAEVATDPEAGEGSGGRAAG